ncbi:nitronate monooxygenase [Sphingorhabdus sp. IMCC26285]|uniref:Propionate 3-nitronate monooxygenase n=1 Tax=Sphingorhabdus profundilacus TaxID=2509718 RepID=A0A6I4M7K9_9SPHN|nr:nitronate monooxygenase [Sphingorhabdus profundilacus]MVZ98085.1 nitronate monooxygenase [Sphingorhabdus profundilacus]
MKLDTSTSFSQVLGIDLPLVQGPFGGGLSTVELAATVAQNGGLGSFGAHSLDGDGISDVVSSIKAQTDRAFALNLWVADHDQGGDDMSVETFDRAWQIYEPYFREFGLEQPEPPKHYHPRFEDQIDALIEARPHAFSFVFGIPSAAILEKCRKSGIITIGAATTPAEVEALDTAGVDAMVASGFEAGGHRPSFIESAEASLMGTAVLVRLAVTKTKKPIIAAGGIADATGIRSALAAGAQAAQLGTAFIACKESGTADIHREVLFSGRTQRTVLTRSYTGRLARGIPNRVIAEFDKRAGELPPFPIHGWFVGKLKAAAMAANIEDFVSLYAGQAAPLLKHRTASALVAAIREEL